ncbi:uncharacterized protein FOMMEDRAFT_85559 [Fomitiporia mediterranea MF3/22]|uniref:uncharacterized protein n=1 Tax=Fomitiporia mediterranea (strain MF3/22) TaxID=694068 RepID=UPI0004408267|nr:uncharacterized protein FOMMEDRAFT_85559 [Fomitiporia mediterranea MF3/22]EJD03115.1 hypothetical protein FOMMEDRAFT_85559 [Fomitiporia mediterranea MF3/22]
MHGIKTPSFLRSSSRPSSPLPSPPSSGRGDSDSGAEQRPARPLTKALALTSFSRKSSPAPARSTTPVPLVQDGSYLESLGLKLSEAVTKALAQPSGTVGAGPTDVLNGKRPIPADRGRVLGELIASELHASRGNIHLQRAILRLLHRPLSVLITNLSSILLPLLSSPAFLSPAAPTVSAPNPNPTQAHALAAASFSGELLESLDGLDLDLNHDHRGDGLNNFREGLVSIIGRVVNPLIGGLKGDLLPLIRALETVHPTSLSSVSVKTTTSYKATAHQHQHPSIVSLQALMPIYTKALRRYTESKATQGTLAAFLISAIWAALVALSHRPTVPRSRSNSMSATSAASSTAFKKRLATSTTPPPTPPPSRFSMKLPGSRPPSPVHAPVPSTASDARVVYDLLNMLPRPSPTVEANRIAREAVDEAFEALGALTALLGAVDSSTEVREDFDLELLTEGLPVLIALPVLLRWSGHGEPQVIPAMLGIDEREYREGCLSGFGRADECEEMVAERMVDILCNEATEDLKTKVVVKYLEGCLVH